jgi:nucleoside-diphosphate-sugar epimerase
VATVVILGCGYTGARVARRMLDRGHRVICTSRDVKNLDGLPGIQAVGVDVSEPFSLDFVPEDSLVLHSIPPVEPDEPDAVAVALGRRPRRVVYLSTTGVYGTTAVVDETSMPSPRHERDWQRLRAEEAVLNGPWSSMVLRPAAIYGLGRGIHVSMAEGRYRLVDGGSNFVSRIHVDDLATHAVAALESEFGGAWPVADEHPCTSREIAAFCADLLRLNPPESVAAENVHHTRRADRRVNGRAIRTKLGIALRYPSYRDGVPASLRK